MKVFRAVALDLYHFAYQTVLQTVRQLLPGRSLVRRLPALPPPLALNAPTDFRIESPVARVPAGDAFVHTGAPQWYVVGERSVTLHTVPAEAFDSVVTTLKFGARVQVHRFEGRWAHVSADTHAGWVLKDALYQKTDSLFPTFESGQSYRAETEATELLRRCIDDMFAGAQSGNDLTSAEYVTYRLWLVGRQICWGDERPRVAGAWQKLLRGVRSVHSGISPQTGAVMEYLTPTGGQLAYVESVTPEETITVSLITEDDTAVYVVETMPRAAWIELRPVFITVL